MSLGQDAQEQVLLQRRIGQAVRHVSFIVPVVAVIVCLVWLLQPLRSASMLPTPPLPSYTPEPPELQEMLVLGPTVFSPQTRGAVRVLIRDPRSGEPLPGVEVRISLIPVSQAGPEEMLFQGATNDLGTLGAGFEVPAVEEGEWTMAIDAVGPVGEQRAVRRITIQRPLVLSVQTHQRIYRPGEQVHVWVWTGGRVDRRPASDQPVRWSLLDPRGNDICGGVVQTSEYGVAQASCTLADGAGEGRYRVVAIVDEETVESELWVESRLPDPLRVSVQLAHGYALAGQPVHAEVQVADACGKPVANADVEVEGRLGTEGVLLFRRSGVADEVGKYAIEVSDQDLLVPGLAPADSVQLTAWAIDAQGRTGRGESLAPVSGQAIVIDARPESAALRPGIENWIRVQTRYPDGRPASCTLEATVPGVEEAIQVETDAGGLARIPVVPDPASPVRIALRAMDGAGSRGGARFDLPVAEDGRYLLLRPEQEQYVCGGTVPVEAWTADEASAVYLDLHIASQLVATHSAAVEGGRARFEVPLPREWLGPIELDAYALLADGTLLRDVRELRVECSSRLRVTVRQVADGPSTHGLARIAVETKVDGGTAAPALVTASLVAPGAWDAENVIPSAERLVPAADLEPQYAETASKLRPISAEVLRAFESYRRAWTERANAFAHAAERISWGAVGLCCLAWAMILPSLWRRRCLLLLTVLSASLVPLLILAGVLGVHAGSLSMGPGVILALGLAWLGVLLAAFAQAATSERSGWLAPLGATAAAGGVLAVGLHYATRHAMGPTDSMSLRGWAGLGGVCLALSAYGSSRLRDGNSHQAVTVFFLVLLLSATWGGALLVGWGPDGLAYQELPPLRPPIEIPIPSPIEAEALLLTLGEETPLPLLAAGQSELLHWVAGAETDGQGVLRLDVPLVKTDDGVRVRAFAVDSYGRWGIQDELLSLAQPLWATVQLPSELTVGDQLDLPVRVRNTSPVSSSVRISVTDGGWFTLRPPSAASQESSIAASGEHTFVLPLRVEAWGEQQLRLSLQSTAWSETITRAVSVQPNGKWVAGAYSWWVEEETGYKFRIPWAAYEDTDRIAVRIYPGPYSVLSDALVHSSQHTRGTFDEVLLGIEARLARLSQLRDTAGESTSLEAALEQELMHDGQRLLAFEAANGGFGPLPGASPDLYRSAAAVRCLSELDTVFAVGHAVVERTAAWLLAQQAADGTWQLADPPPSWATLPHAELPVTAYVAWALLDAGYGQDNGVQTAVQHLLGHVERAQDPYVLGLVTNALLSTGAEPGDISAALDRLAEQAEVRYGIARWYSGLQTLSGASGAEIEAGGYRTPSVRVEVTALATLALARGRRHLEVVEAGMAMLIDSRDVHGTWNAPSPTAWAIRALHAGLANRPSDPETGPSMARVSVAVNGGPARALSVQGDVSVEAVFEELVKGYNDIQITVDGDRMAYQIAGSYSLRWSQVPLPLANEEDLSLDISYDRTTMQVGDTITTTVVATLNRSGTAPLTLVELGLPPGLVLLEADLERLAADGVVARYERVGERLHLYLLGLSSEQPVRLTFRLRAVFPLRVLTLPSYGVDIANPQRAAVRAPVQIVVD